MTYVDYYYTERNRLTNDATSNVATSNTNLNAGI
jgi:hypothetical protein